jgi:pectate lyase
MTLNVNTKRRARGAVNGRLAVVLGCSAVVLATSGGCLDAPQGANKRSTAGQNAGGDGGMAGSAAGGGTRAGSNHGGKGGSTTTGAGGGRPHQGGTGTGATAATDGSGDTGGAGEAGMAGATGATGGGSGGADGNSGEGGMESSAGAPSAGGSGLGGYGGIGASGGTAGASQAGSGSGGMAGDGEVEESFDGPCPTSTMNGWATVAGLGFDPAAATATPAEVVVTDASSLASYAASADPYVIRIAGTIALPVLDVASNKTIMGDDALATLQGGIRIKGTSTDPAGMVSNVVIKNLHINATTSSTSATPDEQDGILISYGHHVWIDHVDVWDATGDNLAVSNGSDFVTVSWSKFRYVYGVRRTGARIGHSDANAAEDAGHLNVTFHHNWWMDSLDQRMPRVRFGQVHVFDNYYSNRNTNDPDNTYCVAAAYESSLLVENNFFDEVYNPHVFFSFVGGSASYTEPTAQMVATGNAYVGASDLEAGKLSGQGSAFVPPYSVTLETADDVLRNTIRHCAGNN